MPRILALVATILLISAPLALSQPARGKPQGTVVIGMRAEPTTLNQGAGAIAEITVGENIFETLVARHLDGTMRKRFDRGAR